MKRRSMILRTRAGNTTIPDDTSSLMMDIDSTDVDLEPGCNEKSGDDCGRNGDNEQDDSLQSSSSCSDQSDSSDTDDSSEVDEYLYDKKKPEFLEDLQMIEKQFSFIRELLYRERLTHVEAKLEEVRSGKAKEYLIPMEQLQEKMRIRIEVAGKLRDFRLINMKNKFEAEEIASKQNFESDKCLIYDDIKGEIEEKINRLEEDRHNDFSSELWLETTLKRKKKPLDAGEKKKKPANVTGPYIVYMLSEVDIAEDWTSLKRALAVPKRKVVEHSGLVY